MVPNFANAVFGCFVYWGGFFVSVAAVAVPVAVGRNSLNSHDFGYGFL